jgi:hypothetical protein
MRPQPGGTDNRKVSNLFFFMVVFLLCDSLSHPGEAGCDRAYEFSNLAGLVSHEIHCELFQAGHGEKGDGGGAAKACGGAHSPAEDGYGGRNGRRRGGWRRRDRHGGRV